jgi:hypothetical protein
MPRDLKPAIIAFPHALQKGALVLLPRPTPAGGKDAGAGAGGTTGKQLRFQYNPESITRVRTGAWEARKTNKAPGGKGTGGPTAPQNQTLESFQGGGLFAKAETISMKLIFDATELLLAGAPAPGGAPPPPEDERALGILPELAMLERMAIANPRADDKDGATKAPGKDSKLDAVIPSELLLVLGRRAFPVVITSMTIIEKRFSPTLVPLRAEIDLQMQMLEAHEVEGNQPIKAAYDQLLKQRFDNEAKAAESVTVGDDGTLDAINQALTQELPPRPGEA